MRALDVVCPRCGMQKGTYCNGTGRGCDLCQARINLAVKTTKSARRIDRSYKPAGGKTAPRTPVRARALMQAHQTDYTSWVRGFATALAEMHRQLINGGDSKGAQATARAAGVTLAKCRIAGVAAYDLRELKKAGIA